MLVNYLSLVIQAAKAVINLIYVLLLLKKPVCYSPLLSLSLHQSQLTVFNTYHSCHQFIFLVSYPFGPLGGFSIQLSSHFSPCPGSPSSSQPWWQTPCQPPALGQVPGWLLLCSHAPVPLHSPCRGGLLVWHHPLLLAQAPGTPAALPALLPAAKSTKKTSLLWENTHHWPQSSQCKCFAQSWVWYIYF